MCRAVDYMFLGVVACSRLRVAVADDQVLARDEEFSRNIRTLFSVSQIKTVTPYT